MSPSKLAAAGSLNRPSLPRARVVYADFEMARAIEGSSVSCHPSPAAPALQHGPQPAADSGQRRLVRPPLSLQAFSSRAARLQREFKSQRATSRVFYLCGSLSSSAALTAVAQAAARAAAAWAASAERSRSSAGTSLRGVRCCDAVTRGGGAPLECAFRFPFSVRRSPLPHCHSTADTAAGARRSSSAANAAAKRSAGTAVAARDSALIAPVQQAEEVRLVGGARARARAARACAAAAAAVRRPASMLCIM